MTKIALSALAILFATPALALDPYARNDGPVYRELDQHGWGADPSSIQLDRVPRGNGAVSGGDRGDSGDAQGLLYVASLFAGIPPKPGSGDDQSNRSDSQNTRERHKPESIIGNRRVAIFLVGFAMLGTAMFFTGLSVVAFNGIGLGSVLIVFGLFLVLHGPVCLTYRLLPFGKWWNTLLIPSNTNQYD